MKKIFILLLLLTILSGCVNTEKSYQKKAEEKIVDSLEQYSDSVNVLEEFDADCLKHWCINMCINDETKGEDIEARRIKCDFECNDVRNLVNDAGKYPQCRKE